MEDAITVKNITKSFKMKQKGVFAKNSQFAKQETFHALENISFTVPKGKMIGVVGLNGSGKTTLLRTIAGIYKPDSGHVKITGRLSPILHIGTGFHEELDARENIIMSGMLLGLSKSEIKEKVDEIIRYAELENFAKMELKHYSSGMRARLAFATALQIKPDILLVDEVLSVGDIRFRKKSFDSFLSFKESGKTILYTTHNLRMISELSDSVILIHQGKLVMVGEPEETVQKYKEITGTTKFSSSDEL